MLSAGDKMLYAVKRYRGTIVKKCSTEAKTLVEQLSKNVPREGKIAVEQFSTNVPHGQNCGVEQLSENVLRSSKQVVEHFSTIVPRRYESRGTMPQAVSNVWNRIS